MNYLCPVCFADVVIEVPPWGWRGLCPECGENLVMEDDYLEDYDPVFWLVVDDEQSAADPPRNPEGSTRLAAGASALAG